MEKKSSIELNIKDRGVSGSSWTTEGGKITKDDLDFVSEQKTNSNNALNALPTPFARFFVFKEAFRRVLEDRKKGTDNAGMAYKRLVSDCLDVYELLFNLKYHQNHWKGKREIVIKEWESRDDLHRMNTSMPRLYSSIVNYYKSDISLERLFFVIIRENGKDKLLATSSPITGFITPPDLDKKVCMSDNNTATVEFIGSRYENLKLQRKSIEKTRGYYFWDVQLFEERPEEFKNYMFRLFDPAEIDNSLSEIQNYIKSFVDTDDDIRNDFELDLRPIESENNEPLEYCGIRICCSDAIDVKKFFSDSIIRLPYRVSEDNFAGPKVFGNEDRNYDYLLPLTAEAMLLLDADKIDCRLKEKGGGNKVIAELSYKGRTYSKTYELTSLQTEGNGKIVDFGRYYNLNLEVGLFPNLKSKDIEENQYIKLMLVVADKNKNSQFDINSSYCTFYAQSPDGKGNYVLEEEEGDIFNCGVRKPVVRTEQSEKNACSTKFYEVFNSEITAVSIHLDIEGTIHSGVLVPKFHVVEKQNNVYTYAIDFGTSNTYISKRLKGSNLEPVQLQMTDTMTSYLHAIKKSTQKSLVDLWEECPFVESLNHFQTEFVPPFIDGKRYKFPLRTALCKTLRESENPSLFDNRNIAFSYEKRKLVGDHKVSTNLKWQENTIDARLFIRELLLIVKCDALQNDANLKQTEIIWFYPLSLTPQLKDTYVEIWREECSRILGIPESQVKNCTESEAPYYYYAEKDVFESINSVAVIDIGGGSTDLVYFIDGKPQVANSIHFGCDVMWGNGYNKMSNARDNGIFQRYKPLITFNADTNISELNTEMTKDGGMTSTVDIINLWISNSDKSKITGDKTFVQKIKEECKPVFLYHYASIIYYMANMFKINGLVCPNALAFSGNGSKYIDNWISTDIETLTDITMIVLTHVYGAEIPRVQLILKDSRKESTCYGGLYRKENLPNPNEILFNGVDARQYDNVQAITDDFEKGTLKKGIVSKVLDFNRVYMEMLRYLVNREDLNNISTNVIETELQQGNDNAFEKNFKQEIRDKLDPDSKYKDSLFFIPIVDKVKDLTMVSKYIK